jgi:hypothetical protein
LPRFTESATPPGTTSLTAVAPGRGSGPPVDGQQGDVVKGLRAGNVRLEVGLRVAQERRRREAGPLQDGQEVLLGEKPARGVPAYGADGLESTCVDGGLVSARHPGVVEEFMEVFLKEMERAAAGAAGRAGARPPA